MTRRVLHATESGDFPATADVIIIGGGPAGMGALWALTRAQPELHIVVLERGRQLGSGASNASLENFRTAWNARCNAVLMQRSVDIFLHANEYFGEGTDLGVRQRGYLFCAMTEAQAAKLRQDVAHLRSVGLDHAEYLDAAEVQARFGWLGERVIAAKFDPVAGWLDSYALVNAMGKSAPNVTFVYEMNGIAITTTSGQVTGVQTPAGRIAAPVVLIAAGADARPVGRTAGVELPIVMRPRQSVTTHWRHAEYPADGPMVIGPPPFPHVRPEARSGAIFGWEYAWNAKKLAAEGEHAARELIDPVYPVDFWKDPRFPSMLLMLIARQFGHERGGFASPQYLRGLDHRAGYYVYRDDSCAYEVTSEGRHKPYESQRAIIDRHPDVAGLFLSIAHVGHGIMSAPGAGEIIAARILGKPLPHETSADFGFDIHFVENDSSGLASDEAVVERL